ncbi:uncharacterized protein B0I36DRAFT_354881 [Microdochium trichocladiopsis]|uniref:Uncharacterized protein n=1 Tax=Microdochium trichocladiopsis TaxID=1682393 RepID=A0A9P8XWJ4_9PEZI|nr:uncharacterized protein B0I36DRAFT_354881 [Microdochium trichocladiopsis]KAH7018621.1 hypothetical protein B0I36DRAFT_354881 [Microdochium trichocladiopsis]
MTAEVKPTLLSIPGEIRNHIHRLLLDPNANREYDPNTDKYNYRYGDSLALFRVNHQIYSKAQYIFCQLNIFVCVEIERPKGTHALIHALGSHVSFVKEGQHAKSFTDHSLSLRVSRVVRFFMGQEEPLHFVMLLENLNKPTHSWLCAHLEYPGANGYLELELSLRDRCLLHQDEAMTTESLQRQLLMPFGMVKCLRKVTVKGNPTPLPSVVCESRNAQRDPMPTQEQCLSEATRLKEEGNKALKQGCQRHDYGQDFFLDVFTERDPPRGREWLDAREKLSMQLLANTCQVFLKLKDWNRLIECGQQTIHYFRSFREQGDMRPLREACRRIPGADSFAKIYYRTALGYKALGEKDAAVKLLRVAEVYLPLERAIQNEIAGYGSRAGRA